MIRKGISISAGRGRGKCRIFRPRSSLLGEESSTMDGGKLPGDVNASQLPLTSFERTQCGRHVQLTREYSASHKFRRKGCEPDRAQLRSSRTSGTAAPTPNCDDAVCGVQDGTEHLTLKIY